LPADPQQDKQISKVLHTQMAVSARLCLGHPDQGISLQYWILRAGGYLGELVIVVSTLACLARTPERHHVAERPEGIHGHREKP
jgi:hypothetical protein